VFVASHAYAINDKILPRLSINYVQGHSFSLTSCRLGRVGRGWFYETIFLSCAVTAAQLITESPGEELRSVGLCPLLGRWGRYEQKFDELSLRLMFSAHLGSALSLLNGLRRRSLFLAHGPSRKILVRFEGRFGGCPLRLRCRLEFRSWLRGLSCPRPCFHSR